jgi:hypothetical protein
VVKLHKTMGKQSRKKKLSDALVGFFVTSDEKEVIEIARKIYNQENRTNKSMSGFLRGIVMPHCKMLVLKFENKNLKELN